MAAALQQPLPSKAKNVRNFHNQTKDIPKFNNNDDSKFLDTVQEVEIWLDERDAQYVLNRDDITRGQYVALTGFLPSRLQDDQDIFWACIFTMFHPFARFGIAIHSRNLLPVDYASQVWKLIYAIVEPEDFTKAASLITKLQETVVNFKENFGAWVSMVHQNHHLLRASGQQQNQTMLVNQLQLVMRGWISINKLLPGTNASSWEIFLNSELPRVIPAHLLTVDIFIKEGTKYERMIGGPMAAPAPIPRNPPAPAAAGRGQPGGLAYQALLEDNQPQGGKVFDPCIHCRRTNHRSQDCQSLPENKEMWCDQCRSRTHWTARCRFAVNDQRITEKGGMPPGRGRGRGNPQGQGRGNGGRGGGRGVHFEQGAGGAGRGT